MALVQILTLHPHLQDCSTCKSARKWICSNYVDPIECFAFISYMKNSLLSGFVSLLFRKCSWTSWYFTISAGHFLKKWEPSLPQFFNSYPPPRLLAMFMYACALSLDHGKANCLNQKKFEDLKKLWFLQRINSDVFEGINSIYNISKAY